MQLAQLLSSRICHDLIGPIGIAAATDDLRDVDDRIDEEALALVADSARTAAARLAFFRFAFGFGPRAEGETNSATLASLLNDALASSRLRIEWSAFGREQSATGSAIPVPVARLVLCLALMASEALPRGGTLAIGMRRTNERLSIVVSASGVGARLPSAAFDAYQATSCADLTPRTVVGYYAGQLATRLNASLEVAAAPDHSVDMTLTTPELGEKVAPAISGNARERSTR